MYHGDSGGGGGGHELQSVLTVDMFKVKGLIGQTGKSFLCRSRRGSDWSDILRSSARVDLRGGATVELSNFASHVTIYLNLHINPAPSSINKDCLNSQQNACNDQLIDVVSGTSPLAQSSSSSATYLSIFSCSSCSVRAMMAHLECVLK